uniref:FtsJ domain-containing protein n=1 Tax=Macrostomum lignano TaxID=282301 RepID=A0A1I8I9F0_9PLAT
LLIVDKATFVELPCQHSKMSSEATAKRNLKMQPDYNKSSRNQASSLQRFKPFIDAAVAAHTSDLTESRGPFVIADFGCSTGLNSSDAVLPPSSLQIGISNICLHWKRSGKQAGQGLRGSFLEARSKELVRGGVIVANFLSSQDKAASIFDEIYKSVEALRSRGVIESEELANFNCPICFRSVEDVSEPSQYERLGLELLRAEAPAAERARLTTRTSCSTETWTGSSLSTPRSRDALNAARSEADKSAVCAELWVEHRARWPAARLFEFTWRTVGVVLLKL